MAKIVAALLAGVLSCSVAVAAPITLREAIRTVPPSALAQTASQPSAPETKPWVERHPVWFGLIAGAGMGAGWGALSCGKSCFPIGPGGAAMVGSWFGAGPGALIGWAIGRNK